MKSRKIIVLLIMNIILIGIICNFISRNGNVEKEKQVIKEMTQSENEANLQTQIDQLNLAHEEYAQNVQKYKKQIAEAVTNQGVSTSENETADVMAENIGKIFASRTKLDDSVAATADNITEGKQAYVNGELIIGTAIANGGQISIENTGKGSIPGGTTPSTFSITVPNDIKLGLLVAGGSKVINGVAGDPGAPSLTLSTGNSSLLSSDYGGNYSGARCSVFMLENVSAGSTITVRYGINACVATVIKIN